MRDKRPNPASIFESLRALVSVRGVPCIEERRAMLRALAAGIDARQDKLLEALRKDLGKSPVEAYTSELGFVLRDIRFASRHLGRWMKKRRVRAPLMTQPGRAFVRLEPKGVCLIIGPWNYPLQLLLSPLVGAIAAGNAACIKPSEFASASARELEALCRSVFPDGWVSVVQGDCNASNELVKLPFDHIFFTGSASIGRLVAEAAARNLTSTTLELGGKSPCVVCADAPLTVTAKRIAWGKCLNAGQTCVAPDHVWVHESVERAFLDELKRAVRALVPMRPPEPEIGDYARIINGRHFDRLEKLLEGTRILDGGERDRERRIFSPTILTDVDEDHATMQEELFGPLLPVLPFQSLDDLIRKINAKPAPLAGYIFTRSRKSARMFRECVIAGGICVNDTVSQILPPDLPFGGVGESGMGSYRGRAGFDCFSHAKPVLTRGFFPDLPFRYPPYTVGLGLVKRVYRWLGG